MGEWTWGLVVALRKARVRTMAVAVVMVMALAVVVGVLMAVEVASVGNHSYQLS